MNNQGKGMSQKDKTTLDEKEEDAREEEIEKKEDDEHNKDDRHNEGDEFEQNKDDEEEEILSRTGWSTDNEEDVLDEEAETIDEEDMQSEEGGPQANIPAREDGEPNKNDDEGTGLSRKDFFKRFERAVSRKVASLSSTLKMYKKETIQKYDKLADSPGAISIVVSPHGSIDYLISDNLNTCPIVKKFAHRLLWAVQISIQGKRYENSEEELAHVVDKDSLPPKVAVNQSKKAQNRQNEYHTQLKHSTAELVGKMKDRLKATKYSFCPSDTRLVCGHPGSDHHDCKEHRKTWNWPENVPFVHPTNLTQGQMLELIDHYGKLFPSCSGAPTQHPNPRHSRVHEANHVPEEHAHEMELARQRQKDSEEVSSTRISRSVVNYEITLQVYFVKRTRIVSLIN